VITARAFAGKHYAVLGLARSGLATVEALLASGARVTAWDRDPEARNKLLPGTGRWQPQADGGGSQTSDAPSTSFAGPPPRSGEDLRVADLDTLDLSVFDSLVVSPGVPLNRLPLAARAREAGLEIIGDIELFARARPELPPHKVVGITGTNGKSTTTALVHHILKTAGVPSAMGGNIGLPILAQDPLPEGGVYVLELSSYQIDLTQSLDCDVAVLLNITPDHLDRYENFEAYAYSKMRLLVGARVSVVNWRNLEDLGLATPDPEGFDGIPTVSRESQSSWPALQGPHNAQNAGAAIQVCRLLGLDSEVIELALRTYPGLPHRMERVREKYGVLFVNDSKATNATATAPALAAFDAVRWILGGQAKSDNLDECAPHFGHVRKAYTIGEAGELFARLLRPHMAVAECKTLDAAVKSAAAEAEAGETVLLSPACASFDQFRDFEERGDRFRELVGAL
jgi:UDP-N-acetylmuramoylalanine--D-glutamate ligase